MTLNGAGMTRARASVDARETPPMQPSRMHAADRLAARFGPDPRIIPVLG